MYTVLFLINAPALINAPPLNFEVVNRIFMKICHLLVQIYMNLVFLTLILAMNLGSSLF